MRQGVDNGCTTMAVHRDAIPRLLLEHRDPGLVQSQAKWYPAEDEVAEAEPTVHGQAAGTVLLCLAPGPP